MQFIHIHIHIHIHALTTAVHFDNVDVNYEQADGMRGGGTRKERGRIKEEQRVRREGAWESWSIIIGKERGEQPLRVRRGRCG
jgi:hypothetical protein